MYFLIVTTQPLLAIEYFFRSEVFVASLHRLTGNRSTVFSFDVSVLRGSDK